jgi:hypothetical protein
MNALGLLAAALGLMSGDSDRRLPSGPAPVQILAQLDEKGTLTLVIPYTVYAQEDGPGGATVLRPETREEVRTVPLKDVKLQRADGAEPDRKRLPETLRKPTPALLSVDGEKIDPLHFRLVRDSTLVFIGPVPKSSTFKAEPKR